MQAKEKLSTVEWFFQPKFQKTKRRNYQLVESPISLSLAIDNAVKISDIEVAKIVISEITVYHIYIRLGLNQILTSKLFW